MRKLTRNKCRIFKKCSHFSTMRHQIPANLRLSGFAKYAVYSSVVRMDDTRAPKQLTYGELVRGSRLVGRPKLRFKDTCKNALKCADVLNGWQSSVNCRQEWWSLIETVCRSYTKKRVLAYERRTVLRREKR